jgi:hypothetical protein
MIDCSFSTAPCTAIGYKQARAVDELSTPKLEAVAGKRVQLVTFPFVYDCRCLCIPK